MVEPEESAYRISTTALALVIGVWGLERPENDPVDHFQRKAGRQALGKQPTSVLQIPSRFALLAASVMDDFRNEIPHGFLNHGAAFQL